MDKQPDWVKRSFSPVCAKLANSLNDESRTWFLSNLEEYLEWFSSKTNSRKSDSQVAEMMFMIKRVNDWVDNVRRKDGSTLKDSKLEAYRRVRNKIYEILLKHVERTYQESNGLSRYRSTILQLIYGVVAMEVETNRHEKRGGSSLLFSLNSQ
ncbi:hypothetical protein NC651_002988 [Populus alba x Populus x berolinensis]|nr:hypothetical protein NC651_002988 [Populus alba x Populus x berolinensis]